MLLDGRPDAYPVHHPQVTDVTSADISCYDSAMNGTATTVSVKAGSVIGLNVDGNPSTLYHPGVSVEGFFS